MKFEPIIIGIGNLICLLIIFVSYIIESISEWKLFITFFRLKKNIDMAHGAANFHALLYFLICFFTVLLDRYYLGNTNVNFSWVNWFILMLPLTIIFRMLYLKFTKIDPDRGNHDFSD